jgi:LDH2 family malate/lactate/ureidoglycolate dehydrogenase
MESLFMPGEIEHNKRVAALQGGIPLGDDVVESLRATAAEASLVLASSLAASD